MPDLSDLLNCVTWDDAPEEARGYCWAAFRWMRSATAHIEALEEALEQERHERRQADAVLDAILLQVSS